MQMPDTDNIDFQYAFKIGYRMAIEGKRVTSMPSNIRRDMGMRDYFQQGWEQALEDVSLANAQANKPEWRKRFIWFVFMVLGGIGTAKLMIYNIEAEKAQQQAIIEGTHTLTVQQNSPIELPNETKAVHKTLPQLSLLSNEQRQDLAQTKQNFTTLEPIPLEPIINSKIKITLSQLSESIENRTPVNPLSEVVPKYIRTVYFFTEVTEAKGKTIFHRWRTDNQVMATVELNIESDKFRTWSSKKLSSAWQGKWYLEVLDENQNVIYRKQFYYGIKNDQP